jgi:capsular exopolysaccharide synthesis family protein
MALPTASVPIISGGAPAGIQMSGGDIWRVIRANLWLIMVMLVISGIAGYISFKYLEKHDSVYSTEAKVRMAPLESVDPLHPGPQTLTGDAMEIEKSTEIYRFRNQALHDDLLKDGESPIRMTSWWTDTCKGDPEIAHEKLNQFLAVTSDPMSQLIKVGFTTSDKRDCPVIVMALVSRAIKDEQDSIRAKFDADHERLVDQMNKYMVEFRAAQTDLKTMTNQIAAMGGELGPGGGIKGQELNHYVAEQIILQDKVVEADTQYNDFMDQKRRGEVNPRVAQMVDADPEVAMLRNDVQSLGDNLDSLPQGTEKSEAYKRQVKLQERYQKRYDDTRADKTASLTASFEAEITSQRDAAHKKLDLINSQIDKLKTDIAEIANMEAAYHMRLDDLNVNREFVKEYEKAIRDVEQMTQQSLSGSLTLFEPPRQPTVPSFPKLSAIMPMALMMGLALSLGIAFLREITDTTVRSPRDIVRVGQMTYLGMVPDERDDPQSSGARLPLVIFESPHSIMAEQLRQVRTRLQHTTSMDTTRSLLVTSPSPGDGKSTIAVNIAAGLALNGRRILLVDSNFRRPELHRIFGVGNETGFSDVLNDVNTFAQNVRETAVPNLSVMSSGPKPSNPTELLESQLLLDFIERALEEYDHVIFDSGPMLFVSESVALAPRVDGVITVVRARTSSRGVLTRMRDGLRAVKAEHLGVVLNGVRSQAGGYYGRSIKTYYEYQNAE